MPQAAFRRACTAAVGALRHAKLRDHMFHNDGDGGTRLRIKICGITNAKDAAAAIAAGADALGFNCYGRSKRYLDLQSAGQWIRDLPSHVSRVAVMVNPTREQALAVAALPFIDALQLHGDETPAFCAELQRGGVRYAKALRATSPAAVESAPLFGSKTIVLDSSSADGFGGTGAAFPWEIASEFVVAQPALRVVLAGGLNPANVAAAIRTVRPFGIDVTTGVESSPGRKDHQQLRAFIDAARAA